MKENEQYFYRVEKNLVGPYFRKDIKDTDWMSGDHRWPTDKSCRPSIRNEVDNLENILYLNGLKIKDCCFGFATLSQLQAWFRPEELRKLAKLGFSIRRVKGRIVAKSSTQVLFRRRF